MDKEEQLINWRQWCRLCAKADPTSNISIYFKDEADVSEFSGRSKKLNPAASIEKYFFLIIERDDELPKMICAECFALLNTLDAFAERVEKVQKMYNTLRYQAENVKCNYYELRRKYGVQEEENDEQLLMKHLVPEVHYLNTKSEKLTKNPLELPCMAIKSEQENVLLLEEEMEVDDVATAKCTVEINEASKNNSGDNDEVDDDCGNDDINESDDEDFLPDKWGLEEATSSGEEEKDCEDEFEEPRSKKKASSKKTKQTKSNVKSLKSDDIDEQIQCTECPRQFKRMPSYRIHMRRVHSIILPPSQFPCTQCSRVFPTQFLLKNHLKLHIPLESRRVLPCKHCDKKFLTNSEVLKHIRHVHMNERYYICEECGMELRSTVSLRVHMLIHSGQTPFKCEVCQKAFREKSKLKNHMEKHDVNKQICPECGHQSNSKFNLRRHMLVHSNNRRFKCDYCGSAFKRSTALKVHLIVHTGLKPYSCNFCDRTFSTGSSCRLHKKTQHPEELAALEAAGGGISYACEVPTLETLKAITKSGENLKPVNSKQK